jgi:hypothetical protein
MIVKIKMLLKSIMVSISIIRYENVTKREEKLGNVGLHARRLK